jgi:multidrug efflux system membrane fusion protein
MIKRLSYLIAIGGAIAAAGCTRVQGNTAEDTPPRPVKVLEAAALEPQSRVRYSVSIQPYEQVPLAFKASGYVAEIQQRRAIDGRRRPLQAGDFVAAGTVLARVRADDYREHLNQAAAALAEVEASQRKAQLDLDRARVLFAAESLTKPELDAAQANYDAAASRALQGRAQVGLSEIALRDVALAAPIAGVVLERKVETGSLVGPSTIGFVIGSVAAVKAVFGVPDSLVHRIAPGQALDITTEALPNTTFEGTVTAIAPSADPESRVFSIELTIDNRDGRLKPGMIGTVGVPAEKPETSPLRGQATVPLAAVVRAPNGGENYSVFVIEQRGERQVARNRPVTLGDMQGNAIAITDGLQPGERVIVMGAGLVADGDAVRVIP